MNAELWTGSWTQVVAQRVLVCVVAALGVFTLGGYLVALWIARKAERHEDQLRAEAELRAERKAPSWRR